MAAYILRRLLLIIPTLLGIMLVSFALIQFAPGGPVERIIAQITGTDVAATARIGGGSGGDFGANAPSTDAGDIATSSKYRGAQGLDPEFIKKLEKQFGFDKPEIVQVFARVANFGSQPVSAKRDSLRTLFKVGKNIGRRCFADKVCYKPIYKKRTTTRLATHVERAAA